MMDSFINIRKQLNISTNTAIMKKILKLSITGYFQSIAMRLKTAMIPMRLINSFNNIFNSIYDIYFQKAFVRLKTKHI